MGKKRLVARNRANELLKTHDVVIGPAGRTYQLKNKETGELYSGDLAGIKLGSGLISKNRRLNKMIGRQLTSNAAIPSYTTGSNNNSNTKTTGTGKDSKTSGTKAGTTGGTKNDAGKSEKTYDDGNSYIDFYKNKWRNSEKMQADKLSEGEVGLSSAPEIKLQKSTGLVNGKTGTKSASNGTKPETKDNKPKSNVPNVPKPDENNGPKPQPEVEVGDKSKPSSEKTSKGNKGPIRFDIPLITPGGYYMKSIGLDENTEVTERAPGYKSFHLPIPGIVGGTTLGLPVRTSRLDNNTSKEARSYTNILNIANPASK
jgi:hypothetical protein